MVKITERQEKFCQEIMQGKTQRQAYYSAYPNSKKWKTEVVDSKASVMANNGKVLVRLEELRENTKKENEITRNDLIMQLKKIGFAECVYDFVKPADKIKALEVIMRILGYDKTLPTTEIEDLSEVESEIYD